MQKLLIESLLKIVRVDAIGANLNPDLVSEAIRTVMPDGSPVVAPNIGKLRYPYCTLVVAPPTMRGLLLRENQTQWQTKVLLAWSFPGATYNQLPVDSVTNLQSRLASKLMPRLFTLVEAKVGAEQIEGSNVWCLMLELSWSYVCPIDQTAPTEPVQPNDFSDQPFDGSLINTLELGLWRTPTTAAEPEGSLELEPVKAESTLDIRFEYPV